MFEIDLGSNKPIYEQLVLTVKEHLLKGYLRPGDAMPSVRSVSKQAGVNSNTVARAYQELERMGLIETVVGRGTFIKAGAAPAMDDARRRALLEQMKPALMEMRLCGAGDDMILADIRTLLASLKEEKA